jgi:hypothetical protein
VTDDRYEHVTFRGHTVDRYTMAALLECERRLGYELTVLQGSYNAGGVGASSGTHDGGGAVDLAPFEADRKVKVAREVGFAAWHRLPSQGKWVEHVHMILVGDQKMSAAAADQVTDYRNGRNGLANHLPDPTPRPNPIPMFNYQGTPPPKSKAPVSTAPTSRTSRAACSTSRPRRPPGCCSCTTSAPRACR